MKNNFICLFLCVIFSGCVSLSKKAAKEADLLDTVWNFEGVSHPLKPSYGLAKLLWRGKESGGFKLKAMDVRKWGLPALPGGKTKAVAFPAFGPEGGLTILHQYPANGVFKELGRVSNYTLIWDVFWPASSAGHFRSLYQSDAANRDDAEMFIHEDAAAGIGVGGNYHGTTLSGRWHRIAVVVRSAYGTGGTGHIHKFIDGHFVGGQTTPDERVPNRWSLGKEFHLLADNNGETAAGFLSSLRFVGRAMSMDEVAALGGPSAGGTSVPGPRALSLTKLSGKTEIIAHRGNSCCAPENTLAAIEEAFKAGADYVEVDVRLISDGTAVLMHDERVDRTTSGTGLVSEMTLEEIKRLDAGCWFDAKYCGEKVPTLAEALRAAAGKGRLLLDVKSLQTGKAIRRALDEAGVPVAAVWLWQNESWEAARDFRGNIAGCEILWGKRPSSLSEGSLKSFRPRGIVGFDVDVSEVTKEFVEAAHAQGLRVSAYTYLSPQEMQKGIDLGLDAIYTDYPALLRSLMP